MIRGWNLSHFCRVVVYFRGLQTHTVDTKDDTKWDRIHPLVVSVQGLGMFNFQHATCGSNHLRAHIGCILRAMIDGYQRVRISEMSVNNLYYAYIYSNLATP